MKKTSAFVLFLCLTFSLSASADQFDPRLGEMFLRLQSTRDVMIASQVENSIWQIWLEHDNPEFAAMMVEGVQLMNSNSLYAALDSFDRLIELAPNYAEAWNKRATIHYLLRDFTASEADIAETLLLEPKHFGAFSGQGLIYMAQGEYFLARTAFYSALEIHPQMSGVDSNLNYLEQLFNESAI
jgi:Tfp pilus assembly protein PilF